MDDLAAKLATSFQVSNQPNTTAAPHPRFSDYKAKSSGLADQEIRRKAILDHQKKKRFDAQSHIRRLTEDFWEDLSEDEEEDMDVQQKPAYVKKPGRHYRDQLMLSEWMIELPEDFEEEWILVPCPVGKRNLVVASYGQTTSWTKSGWMVDRFVSKLPGGSKSAHKWNTEATILDCIYNELTKTFYILDMMNWKQTPLYDTETEFRFYWMSDKLSEYPQLQKISKGNKYRFEALPNFSCNKQNITNVLSSDMNIELDGLLFYHKRAHYTFGSTPLVTWLKAYMVPDIIGCEIPQKHRSLKPLSYKSFEQHVEQVKKDKIKEEEKKAKQEEKRKNRGRRSGGGGGQGQGQMDTSGSQGDTAGKSTGDIKESNNTPSEKPPQEDAKEDSGKMDTEVVTVMKDSIENTQVKRSGSAEKEKSVASHLAANAPPAEDAPKPRPILGSQMK